jgi:hypothetical protein
MNKVLLLFFLGLIFYVLDKYHYPCKKKVSIEHNILHYFHNVTAILIYIGPFIFKDRRILYALLLSTIGLLVQGVINPNKEQACILMPIYNKECGIYENRPLYDIFSLLQIKRMLSMESFNFVYYLVHTSLAIYTISKLMK